MTRFEKEWNGLLGEYWQKSAREEAQKLIDKRNDIEVEEDGAAKWKSNGNYLPADVVQKLVFGGADWFSPDATAEKREIQVEEQIAEYRKNWREPDEEELFEMRAAFGAGEKVVDILTQAEQSLCKEDKMKIYTHNIATDIVEEFETMLDELDITIPDAERTGDEGETRLYGQTYGDLLDDVERHIIDLLLNIQKGQKEFEIEPYVYGDGNLEE